MPSIPALSRAVVVCLAAGASAVTLAFPAVAAPAARPAAQSAGASLAASVLSIVAQPGNTAMYLDWPDVAGASGYTTTVTTAAGVKVSAVDSAVSKSVVTKLVNGTHYFFTIDAVTTSGMRTVGTVEAVPAPVAPQPASAPTLTASTRTTLTITVPALTLPAGVAPLTGYQVRLSPASGAAAVLAVADTSTRKVTVEGLNTGEAYTVDYAGLNTVDGSPAIGPYSAKSLTATPTGAPAPTGVHPAAEGNKNVLLDWDPVDGATKYTVYYRLDGGTETAVSTTTTAPVPSQLKVTGLLNARTYSFQVAATTTVAGVAKVGDRSVAVLATPVSAPIPSDLELTGIGSGKAYLDWNPVSGAESYYLKAEVHDANGIASPAVPAAVKIATTASASTKAIAGLTNGVEYRIRVATTKDAVAGDYSSDAASVLATPAAVPGVTNPSKSAVTGTSIQVTWKAPTAIAGVDAADRYKVTYTPSNGSAPIVHTVGAVLTDTASGLVPGVTYTITVRAGNAEGFGMFSTTPLVLVASDKPSAVVSPQVSRADAGTTARISWLQPNFTGGATIKSYTVTPKQVKPVGTAPAAKTGITGTSVEITGLNPDADYTFAIVANTDAGAGAAVSVGSLAQKPTTSQPVVYDYSAATVTMTWGKVDSPSLSYQAQAVQIPRGASSTTVVTPASLTCDADTCSAVFDRFADNINGEQWSFRVRATDDVISTSSWALAQTPSLEATASDVTYTTTAHAICPDDAQLIEGGTVCRLTRAYTYHTETYGPVESYETAGGCPSGWNQEDYGWVKYCRRYEGRTVRDATPAGWSDSGAAWYQDSTPDSYVTYAMVSSFPWTTTARSARGVVNMLVDGSSVPGRTSDLGRCPGSVTASFTGLAGQVNGAFNLCN